MGDGASSQLLATAVEVLKVVQQKWKWWITFSHQFPQINKNRFL